MHNNPSPCHLTLQAVNRYSSSCCTDPNDCTQLVTNISMIPFKYYEMLGNYQTANLYFFPLIYINKIQYFIIFSKYCNFTSTQD